MLMAIDHCMYFAGAPPVAESYGFKMPELGPNLLVIIGLATNPASVIFFTLAGTSAALFETQRLRKGWSEKEISGFFIKKGFLLIGLDFIIQPLLWNERQVTIDALSAIGANLILLSLLRRLPVRLLAFVGILLTLGYPLILTSRSVCSNNAACALFDLFFSYTHSGSVHVEFPLMARLNLVIAGYIFGKIICLHGDNAFRHLVPVGLAGLLISLVLRLVGSYGNFTPYSPGMPLITFFIESKQPPSIVFLFFNFSLGVMLLSFVNANRHLFVENRVLRFPEIIGKASLFFYVVHIFLYGKVVNQIANLHVVSHTWELAVVEFSIGMALLIPLCYHYRLLRDRFPKSILRYF